MAGEEKILVRRAREADLETVSVMAGCLVRQHHDQDCRRFMLVDDVEAGYRWWFERELSRSDAIIVVAIRGETIVGYAYGTVEGRDWNALLDDHGAIHDIFVAPEARRLGAGSRLLQALIDALEDKGAPRIVLSTMVSNMPAQSLFRAHGFRATMLEMTRGG